MLWIGICCILLYAVFIFSYVRLRRREKKPIRVSALAAPVPLAFFLLAGVLTADYLKLSASVGKGPWVRNMFSFSQWIVGAQNIPSDYLKYISVFSCIALAGAVVCFAALIFENLLFARKKSK